MTMSDQTGAIARRRLLALGALAALGPLGGVRAASAQPETVRRLIIGYPGGGIADRLARLVAEALSRASSASFIVENRPGAGGMIATEYVARAEADGKVLLLHSIDVLAMERALNADPGFDPLRSLAIVAPVARFDFFLVANARLGLRNLQDLIALARRSTTNLFYVDAGPNVRIILEILKRRFELNLVGVPYRGIAPAMTDLLAGRVDLALLDGGAALPQAAAGNLTIVARVDGGFRARESSPVPTLAEQGAEGLWSDTRYALMAPVAVSPAIAENLRALTAGILKNPSFRAQLEQGGFRAIDDPHEQFVRAAPESLNHYRRLAQQAGLI